MSVLDSDFAIRRSAGCRVRRMSMVLSALALPMLGFNGAALAADITGSWSGGGSVILANGAKEKARCRATFRPAGGSTFAMAATCATASAKVSQTAILSKYTATRYGGTFHNPEFNVTGRIRIAVSGNSMTANLSGSQGRATFSLRRR